MQTTANRQVVVTACASARQRGVRAGFSLAQARALCPELEYEEHDPARDAKGLEALARWMMRRFTPTVQCCDTTGIFLDVTGTERLFGSLNNLLERIGAALRRFGVAARLAIGPTPGAAWALTYAPEPSGRIVRDRLGEALSALPTVALRLGEATLATLDHLGLHTVGQVLKLPRELLPARFGPDLLRRVDQALGRVPEPLTPLVWETPVDAGVDFEGAVDSLETLWSAFQGLIARVTGQLARRGLGARRLHVTFLRPYAAPVEKTVDLSSPSRNPTILFNLIRCAMEGIGEGKTVRRRAGTSGKAKHVFTLRRDVAPPSPRRYDITPPAGFTGLRLSVPVVERLSEEQIYLLEQEEHVGRQELDRLIERLRIRLGEDAVVRVEAVECHVPERTYTLRDGGTKVRGSERAFSGHRPLHLYAAPVEIGVMVRPSHDRDGAPISFVRAGESHRIVHAVGPERIAGTWWTGHDKTRDYFDVEDEAGRRWWVFRVAGTSRWFLHGRFE